MHRLYTHGITRCCSSVVLAVYSVRCAWKPADVMFALGALYAAPSSKFDRVIVLREKAPDDLSDVLFLLSFSFLSFTLLFVPSSFFALLAPSLLLRVNLVAAHSRSSFLHSQRRPFLSIFRCLPVAGYSNCARCHSRN